MKSLMVFFALAFASTLVHASDSATISPQAWAADVAIRQSQIDTALAPIRSREDLRAHLQREMHSPLHRLAPAQRERFLASLVFAPEGLASYSFLPLEAGLSVTEVYRVLALFGAQSSIAAIGNLDPATEAESAMLDVSDISTMAAMPSWAHGICVVNGASRSCAPQYGSNCSRACDK
ncbi:hypothetical protein AB4059_12120 [Lysobacter sp. 2RAF19]